MFCRWGGCAILRYLQDMALGTEQAALKPKKRDLGLVGLQAAAEDALRSSIKNKKFLSIVAAEVAIQHTKKTPEEEGGRRRSEKAPKSRVRLQAPS